jgi:uncharacterized protein
MIIKVSEIEHHNAFSGILDDVNYRHIEGESIVFSPISYALTITKFDDLISIKGTINGEVTLICAKCLEEFIVPLNTTIDIELVPKKLTPHVAELELKSDDLDVYYIEGDEIDIDPLIYEEIVLNIPIKPLCHDGCKGLCDVCGKNKNIEECTCNKNSNTLLAEKLKSFMN